MQAELKGAPASRSATMPEVRVTSRILGAGMNVPPRVVPNSYFASYLETSDEWIRDRTGIEERRWVEPGVGVSELAEPACRAAIKNAGLTTEDIDGIVLATVTPDYLFPSSACFLQSRLGIKRGFAFDVNAVCSGFIYALVTADALIMAGQAKNVLVIGADIYSQIINPQDRATCVLFGDGAGAVVLSRAANGNGSGPGAGFVEGSGGTVRGLYGSEIHSDGAHAEVLCVPQGTAKPLTTERIAKNEHLLYMNGREVFKLAVRGLAEVSDNLLSRLQVPASAVDYFVSHQANKRILSAMAKHLDVPEEKVLMNLNKYGNTSAATVPMVLAEFSANGTIKPGDLLLLSAFGGGVTWGAVLLRW